MSCSPLLSAYCIQSSFSSIEFDFILKATCKVGVFPHSLKKLILWNLNPDPSGFKAQSCFLLHHQSENASLRFKYPSLFYKEAHSTTKPPHKAKQKAQKNEWQGLSTPILKTTRIFTWCFLHPRSWSRHFRCIG